MNWQHRTLVTPIDLAEPARSTCMALTGVKMPTPEFTRRIGKTKTVATASVGYEEIL